MYAASLYYSAMTMTGTKWAILGCVLVALLAVSLYFLNRPSASPPASGSRTYALTGLVVRVTQETKHVSVANDDIPGFMQPMVMDYEVADPSALSVLKRGDEIRATLVSDGLHYWVLQNITVTGQH
jgi:Cu/Ag efflux protein CusF